MKKVFLAAASLCLFTVAASAQEEKKQTEAPAEVVVPVSETQTQGTVPDQQLNNATPATDPANANQFEPKKEDEAKSADSTEATKEEE